ncbi:MAG: glycoside hydrolase family 3 protein [Actinomycetota bacterium]
MTIALVLAACGAANDAVGGSGSTSEPTGESTGAEPTLADKAGQMVMAGFRGLTLDEDDHFARELQDLNLGGAVLFDYDVPSQSLGRNIDSPEQVEALVSQLQDLAPTPLLIAVDQEGGSVARLKPDRGFPPTESAEDLAALDDPMATSEAAGQLAETLASMGIDMNLAPVVDLNVNPDNPVIGGIGRSFGADPTTVVEQATAFIEAHHANGVLTSLKHFPGHGSSTEDSHHGFVDVTETWTGIELEPFAELIDAGLADSVMTAHIVNQDIDPDVPATLSELTIQGMLRDELGFDGLVLSDDMQMGAITQEFGFDEAVERTILAGVDMLIISNNIDEYDQHVHRRAVETIIRLVDDGTIPMARIDESYERIQQVKERIAEQRPAGA